MSAKDNLLTIEDNDKILDDLFSSLSELEQRVQTLTTQSPDWVFNEQENQ